MGDSVIRTVPFSITPREFADLTRRAVSRRRLAVYGLIVVALLAEGAAAHNGARAPLFGAAVGLVACVAYGVTYGAGQRAKKIERSLSTERQMTFSEDSVDHVSAESSSTTGWGYYVRLRELGDDFVLVTHSRTWVVVPRRAFESTDDAERFRDLATRKITAQA